MLWFKRLLRQLAFGVAGEFGAVLLAWGIGGISARGPAVYGTSRVLGIEAVLLLLLTGMMVVTVAWGPHFRLKLNEEDYNRRASLIPVLLALTVTVLIAYFLVPPPSNPATGG